MPQVHLPVIRVPSGQFGGIADNEKILGISFLRTLGEVETAGDNRPAVDDHHLVMGDLVGCIDVGRYSLVGKECG